MTPSWLLTVSSAVTAVLALLDAVLGPTAPAWHVLRAISAGVLLIALTWWLLSKVRPSSSYGGPESGPQD